MKRSVFIFLVNSITAIALTGTFINLSPYFGDKLSSFNIKAMTAASPVALAQSVDSKYLSDKTMNNKKIEHTTNASSSKTEQVMHRIAGKDSNSFPDIASTPDDIKELIKKEKSTIKTKKKIGKTSEEDYRGGGTIISFDSVAIQSKIPESVYKPNIEKLLKQKADLSISDYSQPTVLIYHSHTTESYAMLDEGFYTSSDARSTKANRNMVRVGDDICDYLKRQGIGVIHDRKIHDEDYNSSYDSSKNSIEKYLEEYPSIEITIDVHRDDITYENKTKVKPTAVINGKKAARMMIIAGCEYGRVTNFSDWKYNLRFDLAVQNQVEKTYPGLMRPILFSERKYNMDETRNSFLLEVGTDANTLDEACYSGRMFAAALGQMIIKDYSAK